MALAKPSTCAAMPPTTRGGYSQDSISTRIDVTVAAGRVTYAAKVLLGEQDLHFFGEGTHRRLWEWLGAQPLPDDGGVQFAVWAPNAKSVRVVGDWDGWVDGDALAPQGKSGVWAGVAKSAAIGYPLQVRDRNGKRRT
jgi:1,4-alpha-glucan branching enzyme